MHTTLCNPLWMPDPHLGARLVGRWDYVDDLSPAWIPLALRNRASVAAAFGPFAQAPRCHICPCAGAPTFMLRRTAIKTTPHTPTPHHCPTSPSMAPWICISCGKPTKATDTTPMSAHQALVVWAATLERLPAFLREDALASDGWPKAMASHPV